MNNKKLFFLLMLVFAALISSCKKPEPQATISLSGTYADLTGEKGSTASLSIISNFSTFALTPEDSTITWYDMEIDATGIIKVTSLSINGEDDERWANVKVTVTGDSPTNTASTSFTIRQAVNSDAVKVICDKTQPILSAAAYGEKAGYGEIDNRYIIKIQLINATDFDISWDNSVTWLTNVEKYYEKIDETDILAGICISTEKNSGSESRSTNINISVTGAEYATKTITLYQKSNPFGFKIGDYSNEHEGTIIYLDIEKYNFYLVLDNKEAKLPFVLSTDEVNIIGTPSVAHTAENIAKFIETNGADKVNSTNFPALFYIFNRNAPEGTEYKTISEVPSAVINDESKWHMMSRDELAYVFKRTLYEEYVDKGATEHTFNLVLEANAAANGVEIANIATSGTIYWSSYTGASDRTKATGYATTNLNSAKKNTYSGYRATENTKSYARAVKKIIVDDNE